MLDQCSQWRMAKLRPYKLDCDLSPLYDTLHFINWLWWLVQNPWCCDCYLTKLSLGNPRPLDKIFGEDYIFTFPLIKHVFQQVVTLNCKFHTFHVVTYFTEKGQLTYQHFNARAPDHAFVKNARAWYMHGLAPILKWFMSVHNSFFYFLFHSLQGMLN